MAYHPGLDRAGSPFAPAAGAAGPPPESRLPRPLARIGAFFSETVWAEDRPRKGALAFVYRVARIVHLSVRGFVRDDCLFRASALTYITVLSLVPLLAFSFSVAKGFGFYEPLVRDTVNPFLDRTFGPIDAPAIPSATSNHEMRVAIDRVLQMVGGVVQDTKVTSLGAFGLVILGWAVIKLLGTIERSFNQIWGVQRPRSILRKVSDYLAMVVVTPIFLFTATAITAAATSSGLTAVLRESLHLGAVLDLLVASVPLLALWLGFTFVYLAMPNARTRVLSAAIGAVVGGTLWHLTLLAHIEFQVGIARYNAIYSSFAAIPIFLIWIQFSWVSVLVGAEVCFAHQSEPGYLRLARSRPADHAFMELLGLRAMSRIGERFLSGGDPWTSDALATGLEVPVRPIEEVLAVLVQRGLVAVVPFGSQDAFLPARDLDSITVKSVIDALKGTSGPVAVPARSRADHRIDRILATLDAELTGSRSNLSLRSLAQTVAREEAEERERERAAAEEAAGLAEAPEAPEIRGTA
jgi:membrane protein